MELQAPIFRVEPEHILESDKWARQYLGIATGYDMLDHCTKYALLFTPVIDRLGHSKGRYRPIVHGVVEPAPRQDQAINEGHCDADLNARLQGRWPIVMTRHELTREGLPVSACAR